MIALSPVIITTSIPIFFRVSTASLEFSFRVSATATSPIASSPIATSIAVFPFSSNLRISVSSPSKGMEFSSMSLRVPRRIFWSSRYASIPFPGIERKFFVSARLRSLSSAPLTIASPSGCSDPFSAVAAIKSTSCCSRPETANMSVNFGVPSVSVPVLSNTMVSSLCALSRASPPFIRTPFSAPLPVPTIIAAGVASPTAHGQEITRTVIAISKEKRKGLVPLRASDSPTP
ncbi:hypothetical protein SDC9_145075 [bioreactor metagenome]|uniref:Uncharacterized protein n=1 Tax=bioreactor metagenome TaxID=1076179 RepID=A0A645E8T8_9ZZZZ